jgi:hypothetical protein
MAWSDAARAAALAARKAHARAKENPTKFLLGSTRKVSYSVRNRTMLAKTIKAARTGKFAQSSFYAMMKEARASTYYRNLARQKKRGK